MRDATAHHHAVQLAGTVQVIRIAAFAAQQHRVFLARHRLTDGEFFICRRVGRQRGGVERRIHRRWTFIRMTWASITQYPIGYSARAQPGPMRRTGLPRPVRGTYQTTRALARRPAHSSDVLRTHHVSEPVTACSPPQRRPGRKRSAVRDRLPGSDHRHASCGNTRAEQRLGDAADPRAQRKHTAGQRCPL